MAYTIKSLGFGQVAVLLNGKHVKKFGGPSAPTDARMFINKQHQDSLPKERAPGLKDRQVAEELTGINNNIGAFTEDMLEDFTEDEINDMIEKYEGFEKLTGELKAKGAKSPEALAAWIGRKKYGKKKFQKMGEAKDDWEPEKETKEPEAPEDAELKKAAKKNKEALDKIGSAFSKLKNEATDLDEKKLTPAELKKREEIAKAIGRENPGMEMGKKMAIATAQAKKVAEEKEESEDHEDEVEDKKLVKKMVKKDCLKTEGFADQFFDGEIIRESIEIEELQEADKNYDAYFKAMMKKAGITSIADLKTDDAKKEFMNSVDAGFSAKNEEVLYEEFMRADIEDKVRQHRKMGHKVDGIVHKIHQGKPYAEFTVTQSDGSRKKYIFHGNITRHERLAAE